MKNLSNYISFFYYITDKQNCFFNYLSCCVDTVAAEHYECDSLVHFGHSCLSLVEKLPVFYVFEKFTLNLDLVETEVGKLIVNNKPNQKLVILYDVEYYYLYGWPLFSKHKKFFFLMSSLLRFIVQKI